MVLELLSLVHAIHGHPGVAATLILVRERFFWPTIARDFREYVLSCKCRMRKRSNSQWVPMFPGRAIEPWEVMEMDVMSVGTESLGRNKYLLLVVDKASKYSFAFPLHSKQAEGVARHLLQLCLTLGVPQVIGSDGGGEFEASCIQHLCRWLKAIITTGQPITHVVKEQWNGWEDGYKTCFGAACALAGAMGRIYVTGVLDQANYA